MSAGDDTTPPAEPERCALCGCHHQHDDADVISGPRGCILCRWCSGDFAAAGPRAGDTAPDDECTCDDCNPEIVRLRAELDRLRSDAAALERQRDHLQGQLDIIHDAEYTRNDALRRENARLRAAGNTLAHTVVEMLTGPVPEPGDWWHRLAPLADAWWSAAGTPTTDGGEHR